MKSSGIKNFQCQRCGKDFQSTANHAKFCTDCRALIQLERVREYNARKQSGETNLNSRGTIRICKTCGKEFPIRSASQQYCSDACKKKRKSVSSQVIASRKKNSDTFSFYLPKGCRENITAAGEQLHCSSSDLFRMAVIEFLNRTAPEQGQQLLAAWKNR